MNDDEPRDAALQRLFAFDDRDGPATPMGAARANEVITQALDDWQTPARKVSPMRRPSVRWQSWAMAAAALLVCMATARALYVWASAKPASTGHRASTSTAQAPRADTTNAEPARAIDINEVHEEPPRDSVSAPKRVRVTDVDHLARANRLRAEGRYAEAVRAYQRVIASDDAASAYVAHVAAASLWVEHLGDRRRARALFVAARQLQPHGALEREIAQGLAACDRP